MKKTIIATLLAGASLATFATDFYVVVPVKGRSGPPVVKVALNNYTLPEGVVGVMYPAVAFKTLLQVTGDSSFDGNGVTWTVVSGSLPAGLTLSAEGVLAGTPAASTASTFVVQAEYKTKTGQQSYSLVALDINVSLADAALPSAQVGAAYSYSFGPHLAISGDPALDLNAAAWSASSLPPGLSLSSKGVLSGVPEAPNSTGANVPLAVTYKSKAGSKTYSLDVTMTWADPTWDAASFGGTKGSVTLSNGNRTATLTSGLNGVAATIPLPTKGKWYWEADYLAGASTIVGIASKPITSHIGNGANGMPGSCGYSPSASTLFASSTEAWKSTTSAAGSSAVLGFAFDASTRTLTVRRGNTLVGQCGVSSASPLYAVVTNSASATGGTSVTLKMHPSLMTYAAPAGYTQGVPATPF